MLFKIGGLKVELNVWNPLYAMAPFLLFLVSLPLAVFAVITTSLAISLLFFRAAVVYVQLAVAVTGAWFDSLSPKASRAPVRLPPKLSPQRTSPNRHRTLRSSNTSAASSQETIVPGANSARSGAFGSSEIPRDYEGVGGWRSPGDEDEEALWMGLNSRLQLPADTHTRRHQRSLTGSTSPAQRWSWSPETNRMSPVQSRSRTPVRFVDESADYFPPQLITNLRPLSTASESVRQHKRRKSGSGDSTSSVASVITMTAKEEGR